MITLLKLRVLQTRLAFGCDDFKALRVQHGFEIAPVLFRFGFGEEAVVEAHFSIHGVCGTDPMDRAFDFARGSWATHFAVEVGGATQFGDVAARVFHNFFALDDEGVF